MTQKLLKAKKPNEYIHVAGYKAELKDDTTAYMFFAVDNQSYFGLDAKVFEDNKFETYQGFINELLTRKELQKYFKRKGKTTLVIDLSNRHTRKFQKDLPKHVKVICDKKLSRSVTDKIVKAIF